ncbi:glycosyltransferase family 39 protein [Actinoplanes sp. NPDC051494]|uniref:glycosyltransferase family 39 protein n=1 Tax=Actinoplanes sp. NPDC051494 TaxID=3363907 RepID=UPI00379D5EA0
MLPPFVVTLIVMLIEIGHRQLWADENATWWSATLTFPDLRKLIQSVDIVLLPYYVFMHGWIAVFGDSETSLRMPSALSMALAAGVLALIGRRLFDAPAGILAGLLVALVPAVSRYGQEARPYAMATLATVTAIWLLLRALERPTVGRWVLYSLAVMAIGFSHVVSAMALAAHFLLVLRAALASGGRERLRLLIGWPLAVIVAVVTFSPLALKGSTQNGQISWVPPNTWARVQAFPEDVFMNAGVAGFAVALGLIAVIMLAFEKQQRWTAGFLATWALLPPVIAYYTFPDFHFFYPRYMLFTVPAWLLLAGVALRRFAGEPAGPGFTAKIVAAGVAAVAILAFLGWPQQTGLRHEFSRTGFGYREAAAHIRALEQPGDGIVFANYPYAHRGFRYEWRDQPRSEQPREVLWDVPPENAYSWKRKACPDLIACLGTTQRIWLVATDPTGSVLSQLPAAQRTALRRLYVARETTSYHRLRVTVLVRKPAT